ncbi:hypothetical protein CsSME_00015066 [Camellia sinensis var. sinensis]
MSSGSDLWSCFGALLGGNMGVEVDPDLSKFSFERSFSSGNLRGELHPDVWRCLGSCSMFWVVNIEASAVGVFGVWIGKNVSDHGSGDGSGSCSSVVVSFDRPWVFSVAMSAQSFGIRKEVSDHRSGAGCGACGTSMSLVRSVQNESDHGSRSVVWRGSRLWWVLGC